MFYPGEDLYDHARELYWGQQQWLNSTCIVTPESADDVQHIVQELNNGNCRFAIRSGGHGLVLEENSIRIGVTINLGYLNQTILSADKILLRLGLARSGVTFIEHYVAWVMQYRVDVLGRRV